MSLRTYLVRQRRISYVKDLRISRRKGLIQKSSNTISACIVVTFLVQLIYLCVIKKSLAEQSADFFIFGVDKVHTFFLFPSVLSVEKYVFSWKSYLSS